MNLPSVQTEIIVCKDGMDQVTPTLSLAGGVCRQSLNFECGVNGGYNRIAGYERFDGQPSPTDNSVIFQIIEVATVTTVPVIGDTLTASGGATGTVAYVDGTRMVVCQITGTYATTETVSTGAGLVGTVSDVSGGPSTPLELAQFRNAVADIFRADIAAVPGKNAIRGVVEFNDVVYAVRDEDATPVTKAKLYKSTSSGWSEVAMLKQVAFTVGNNGTSELPPAEGLTLTQGGVTAVIKRVATRTGVWNGAHTAVGIFVIDTLAGGSFAAGAATFPGGSVTLGGVQTDITLPPAGVYEFVEYNFYGQSITKRLYGVNGVGKAFEFDGTILTPIATGATTDTPSHIACFKTFLVLTLGSSLMGSMPGDPFYWDASVADVWEIPTGDTITGIKVMPGTETGGTLGVTSRDNTGILYGNDVSDLNFVQFNTGTGAVAYTIQNLSMTLMYDDRGASSLRAAQDFGNFSSTMLTSKILPFINGKIGRATASTVSRRKSQYRVFYSDGYALYITLVNNKLLGCMPVFTPMVVNCAYEGKSAGVDVMYVGASDGFVYQLDKGTSFDGTEIDYMMQLVYASQGSPRVKKRYRKAAVEVYSEAGIYSEFYFNHVLGYASDEYSQPVNLNYADFISGGQWQMTAPWSDYGAYLQDGRWDGNLTWDQFFYDLSSTSPIECELDGTGENISLIFYGSSDIVGDFTINSVLLHYSQRRLMR
jgi:hypothetical protein